MVPIKITCGCGQHYAFEVEPEDGRMMTAVACPACGGDGTAAANDQIAQHLAGSPTTTRTTLQLTPTGTTATKTSAGARSALHASQLGMVSREQAEIEARAKVSWGDSAEEVIKYLMIQGFEHAEADELVQELFRERTALTRANGMKKTMLGTGLALVPVVAFIIFSIMGAIPLRLMGIAIAIGIWGLWKIISGTVMILAPKMEKGDVAEQ